MLLPTIFFLLKTIVYLMNNRRMFNLEIDDLAEKPYSKALRCTFFGERKKSCSSKFVQLLLLNRMKARWLKNRAAQGFHYINSFISNIFGPNSKTCTCKVRAAWGRVSRGLTVYKSLMASHCLDLDLNDQKTRRFMLD